MNAFIKLLYSLVIAGSVVAFVGFGIYSLYQPPKQPDYPYYPEYNYARDGTDAAYQKAQDDYDKKLKGYDDQMKTYDRNITYVTLVFVPVFVVGGLYLFRRSDVIGEGLSLGGTAISIYAIVTSSMADQRILRFVAVSLLLASVLVIAHRRFNPKVAKRV